MDHFFLLNKDIQRLILQNLTAEEQLAICGNRTTGVCSEEDILWYYRIEDEFKLDANEQTEIIIGENLGDITRKGLWLYLKEKEHNYDTKFLIKWKIWDKYLKKSTWGWPLDDIGRNFEVITKDDRFLTKYIDSKDGMDLSALMYSIAMNDENSFRYLIEKGANININSKYGTPLWIALLDSRIELVKELIRAGADISETDMALISDRKLDVVLNF